MAVSNLRNYVVQERRALAARNLTVTTVGSPRKTTEKLKPDLQLLHAALEKLHSNICESQPYICFYAISHLSYSGYSGHTSRAFEDQSCYQGLSHEYTLST